MKFLPTLTGAASGSLGGLTASHNRGGQYLRRRTIPVNTTSAARSSIRGAFASLATYWVEYLTPVQRQTWADYAAAVPVVDRLGQTRYNTGMQWFIALNSFALFGDPGENIAPTAPGTFTRGPAITDAVVSYGVPTDLLAGGLIIPGLAIGDRVYIWFSRPVNSTVNYFKGPWSLGGFVTAVAVDTVPIAALASPFTLTVGQKFFLRFVVQTTDRRTSPELIHPVTVTADEV